jgi:hypothetical protein
MSPERSDADGAALSANECAAPTAGVTLLGSVRDGVFVPTSVQVLAGSDRETSVIQDFVRLHGLAGDRR